LDWLGTDEPLWLGCGEGNDGRRRGDVIGEAGAGGGGGDDGCSWRGGGEDPVGDTTQLRQTGLEGGEKILLDN
jgi:hypothetical protein